MFTNILPAFLKNKKKDYSNTSYKSTVSCTVQAGYMRDEVCGNFIVKMEPQHQSKSDTFQYPAWRECNSPFNWRSVNLSFWVLSPSWGSLQILSWSSEFYWLSSVGRLVWLECGSLLRSHCHCRMSWHTYTYICTIWVSAINSVQWYLQYTNTHYIFGFLRSALYNRSTRTLISFSQTPVQIFDGHCC